MRRGTRATCSGHDSSERHADYCADEARLGSLLDRAYAAREARLAPPDDALAKLNAALDAIGTPRRHTNHRRLLVACALTMLFLLLVSPVARSEFTASSRRATRSAIIPMSGTVGGVGTDTASVQAALPPIAVAASKVGSVAPPERSDATGHAPDPNGTTLTAGASETPLQDLLARAGIRASDPPGGPTTEGTSPHQ